MLCPSLSHFIGHKLDAGELCHSSVNYSVCVSCCGMHHMLCYHIAQDLLGWSMSSLEQGTGGTCILKALSTAWQTWQLSLVVFSHGLIYFLMNNSEIWKCCFFRLVSVFFPHFNGRHLQILCDWSTATFILWDWKTVCESMRNTTSSYWGGPRFESWPRDWLSWMRFLWFSSVPAGKFWDTTLKWVMTVFFHLFSNSSFTYHSRLSMLYSLSCWKSVSKDSTDI